MNLRDRLERAVGKPEHTAGMSEEKLQEGTLREKLEQVMGGRLAASDRAAHESVMAKLGGALVENSWGTSIVVTRHYAHDHQHGQVRLSSFFKELPRFRGISDKDSFFSRSYDPGELLFLDTETTGLAGGAGTCAFLIGAGFFDDHGFHIHQFFMRDFDEEKSMLCHFRELLSRAGALVTFNGKAFDVPLIEGRFIMNRNAVPIRKMPHLDLLFLSRSLWSGIFADCRLKTLEEHVIGAPREGDIEGSQIPACYFDFIRTGRLAMMDRIFSHNRLDIITLVALASKIGALVSDPLQEEGERLIRLGRFHQSMGNRELGEQCMEKALCGKLRGEERYRALLNLSLHYRRGKKYREAVELWELMIRERPDPFASLELAKYWEHHEKDCRKALRCVTALLEGDCRLKDREREALEHRRRRLEGKLSAQPS